MTRIGIWPWDLPDRIVRWPASRSLEGDVGAGVGQPDDEHRTRRGAAPGCGTRASGVCRIDGSSSSANAGHVRLAERPGRDDHLAGGDPTAIRTVVTTKPPSTGSTRSTRGAASDGQLERARRTPRGSRAISRPVGQCQDGAGNAHARERVVARRAVQLQRVPAIAPVVADPGVRIEDHERQAALREVVAGRQAGLARADHDGVDRARSPLSLLIVRSVSGLRSRRRPTGPRPVADPNLGVASARTHRRKHPIARRGAMGTASQTRRCS